MPHDRRELRFRLESARTDLEVGALGMLNVPVTRESTDRLERLALEATCGTIGEREIISEYVARSAVRATRPAPELLDLARRALDDGSLTTELAV